MKKRLLLVLALVLALGVGASAAFANGAIEVCDTVNPGWLSWGEIQYQHNPLTTPSGFFICEAELEICYWNPYKADVVKVKDDGSFFKLGELPASWSVQEVEFDLTSYLPSLASEIESGLCVKIIGNALGEIKTSSLCVEYCPVPVPPAVWLMGSGLVGLLGLRRRFSLNG